MFDADIEDANFLRWANGDTAAVEFLKQVTSASQLIDDLADGDVSPQRMMATLGHMVNITMLHLPGNTFLQKHAGQLQPVMLASFLNWSVSTKWQDAPELEKRLFAYVLRESLDQIISVVAYLTGGMAHAMQTASDVAEFYHAQHAEPLAGFLREHDHG